ncbi:unnamed protein product, partial [Symbiodinium sp. CCMP2456]
AYDALRRRDFAISTCLETRECPNAQFLVFAAVNVQLQIASTLSQGWLATKWVLAGEQPGIPLVACFCVVAANTELLVSAGLAAHLRALLVKVAIQQRVKIRFSCLSNVLGSQVGKVCVCGSAISTVVLCAHLYEKPLKLLAWLGSSAGLLIWANSNFKSIGLMAGEVWDELKPTQSAAEELTVAEFLSRLGLTSPEEGTSWLAGFRWPLSKEDELLLDQRTNLMTHAFPARKYLRFGHGFMIIYFSLLNAAVPCAMASYCLLQSPRLQDVEVIGGSLATDFNPSERHYYVTLLDERSQQLTLNFEVDLGQASQYFFCKRQDPCAPLQPQPRSDKVRLTATIAASSFGTCSIKLLGVRSSAYSFTVLALSFVKPELQPPQAEQFLQHQSPHPLYRVGVLRSEKLKELSVRVAFGLDHSHMKLEYSATSCNAVQICKDDTESVHLQPQDVLVAETDVADYSNLTLQLKLLPKDPRSSQDLSSIYTVSVSVVTLRERLGQLVLETSLLEAELDSLQELEPGRAEEVRQKLQRALKKRDELLWQAYHEQQDTTNDVVQERLTFLAVGLTGTGKSELCRWMTGDLAKCTPSRGTESNTTEVIRVSGRAFGDGKILPEVEWIDTPGRGDTRGQGTDDDLWKRTMHDVLEAGHGHVDTIVWVMNAAWQRGTADREFMLTELRRSFGIHLYPHLSIVLNFLQHSANQTEYTELLSSQKKKFADWIMSVEEKIFNWNGSQRLGVARQVHNLSMYGVSIDPVYYVQKPHNLPLSAPYLDMFPPFSHPAGVDSLFSLFNATRTNKLRNLTSALPLHNPHPQIGPGTLRSIQASCNLCGFSQKDGKLVPGIVGVRASIRGEELSKEDRAVVILSSSKCGDPDRKDWPTSWQERAQNPNKLSAGFDLAHFDLPVAPDTAGSSHRLCFCEAPSCNASWRFGQDGGLVSTTDLTSCPSPFYRIYPSAFGWRVNRTRFVQVGSQLLGWTSNGAVDHSDTFPVLDLKSERMWGIKVGWLGPSPISGISAAVVGHKAFLLATAGPLLML